MDSPLNVFLVVQLLVELVLESQLLVCVELNVHSLPDFIHLLLKGSVPVVDKLLVEVPLLRFLRQCESDVDLVGFCGLSLELNTCFTGFVTY